MHVSEALLLLLLRPEIYNWRRPAFCSFISRLPGFLLLRRSKFVFVGQTHQIDFWVWSSCIPVSHSEVYFLLLLWFSLLIRVNNMGDINFAENSLFFYSVNAFPIIGVGLFTFLTIMMLSVFQRAKQLLVYLVNRNSRCKYKSANMRFASFLHQCYQHFFNSTYQHVKSLIFRLYFYDLFITAQNNQHQVSEK